MKRRDLLFIAGLCFLSAVIGGVIAVRLTNLDTSAKNKGLVAAPFMGAKSKAHSSAEVYPRQNDALHSSKDEKAWIEATKGWDQAGNRIYTITDSVGIGTTTPTAKLHVAGKVKIVDATQDAGKVLTSDADGLASWQTSGESVPAGIIIMWSGTQSNVPSGWALCDGTNGTPDLHDKFILADTCIEAPRTGGANSYTLTVPQLPVHNHAGATSSSSDHIHSGSTSTDGAHTHNVTLNTSDGTTSLKIQGGLGDALKTYTSSSEDAHDHIVEIAGSGGAHTHTFTTDNTGSGTSIDNRPAFYKLAFIMKL